VNVPEITYAFNTPKDVAGPTAEVLSRVLNTSGLAASLTVSVTGIPRDRILILQNVAIESFPDALQSVNQIRIQGFTGAGQQFEIARTRPSTPLAVSEGLTFNWQGSVWLHGRAGNQVAVSVVSTYNAGVTENFLSVGLQGIVIPRGNVAMF